VPERGNAHLGIGHVGDNAGHVGVTQFTGGFPPVLTVHHHKPGIEFVGRREPVNVFVAGICRQAECLPCLIVGKERARNDWLSETVLAHGLEQQFKLELALTVWIVVVWGNHPVRDIEHAKGFERVEVFLYGLLAFLDC